jgi:hypothetical protein
VPWVWMHGVLCELADAPSYEQEGFCGGRRQEHAAYEARPSVRGPFSVVIHTRDSGRLHSDRIVGARVDAEGFVVYLAGGRVARVEAASAWGAAPSHAELVSTDGTYRTPIERAATMAPSEAA